MSGFDCLRPDEASRKYSNMVAQWGTAYTFLEAAVRELLEPAGLHGEGLCDCQVIQWIDDTLIHSMIFEAHTQDVNDCLSEPLSYACVWALRNQSASQQGQLTEENGSAGVFDPLEVLTTLDAVS